MTSSAIARDRAACGATEPAFEVVSPGMATTIQDWPGRRGYWQIGVPPSGPMDDQSFRLANRAVGNHEGLPALEATMVGPVLRAMTDMTVCVAGARARVRLDGHPVAQWVPLFIGAGQVLDVSEPVEAGMRVYIAVRGGFDVEEVLGSAATFALGRMGGFRGRVLVGGDVLPVRVPESAGSVDEPGARSSSGELVPPRRILGSEQPYIGRRWELAVAEGPHAAPEFFTRDDMHALFSAEYRVSFNSDRTGVRLEGPKPEWAREDGGEAGLHPSNIHDNAYSVGTLDFTGDTPILLGPDGPSLGGFTCPVTVVTADRWKLGQLAPGDTIRFRPVKVASAASANAVGVSRRSALPMVITNGGDADDGVLGRGRTADGASEITWRRSGDDNILIEYGPAVIDLESRARAHVLQRAIEENADSVRGVLDLTPGIRSLMVHYDPDRINQAAMFAALRELEAAQPAAESLVVPSRIVHLPLSWDDPSTKLATERYMTGVRSDAPWCPWNIEFIRRMNGLGEVDDVKNILFDAEYLVMGLGDVYLGAPVALPLDPRHRLVTTKYNPARTWTPENAVGIGGSYLCIYGMEGPGGYQFVGRTTQVWNHRHPAPSAGFDAEHPWLLRFFDRIRWYPVSSEELTGMRADMAAGRGRVEFEDGTFSLAEHRRFLSDNARDIEASRLSMEVARAEERARWVAAGEVSAVRAIDSASA